MYNLAFRYVRRREDAEDLVAEATLRAWFHRDQFDPSRAGFEPWLIRLFVNSCIDAKRREKRRIAVIENTEDAEQRYQNVPAPEPVDWVLLESTLDVLEANQRRAIVLTSFLELSAAEAGAILGMREGTVRSHCSRARHKLAKQVV